MIPKYLKAKSDVTTEEEPDLNGAINMSHAEQKDVRSNEPGKPANDKDCAQAS